MAISIGGFLVGGFRLSQPESLVPMNGSDQKAGRSSGEIRPSASVPTSALSGPRCNKSGVAVSSATLPLPAQSLVCCINRLNPPGTSTFPPPPPNQNSYQ